MKLPLAFLIAALSALPLVCATTVFDNWVYQSEQFTFDGITSSIIISPTDTIKIDFSTGGYIVLSPGGQRQWNGYVVTYDRVDREVCTATTCSPRRYGRIDPTTNQVVPGVKLLIVKESPKIKITRTVANNELLVNTSTRVTITVKNEGDSLASNVEFIDIFPDGIEILDARNALVVGKTLQRTIGTLMPGQDTTFYYTLRMTERVQATLAGKIYYRYDNAQHETQSNVFTIKSRDVFTLTRAVTPSGLVPGNISTLTLSVKNTNVGESERARITSLIFQIPPDLEVVSVPPQFRRSGTVFTLEDMSFASGENKSFIFTFNAQAKKNFVINGSMNTFFRQTQPTLEFSQAINYGDQKHQKHNYDIEIYPSRRDYLEGSTAYAWLIIHNKDTKDLYDIRAIVNINGTPYQFTLDRLAPQQSHIFQQIAVNLPLVEKSVSVNTETTLSMRTAIDNSVIAQTIKDAFTIKDIADAVEVRYELTDGSTIRQNQTTIVTVKVRNKLQHNALTNITVDSVVPAQFSPPAIASRAISLDYAEEQSVFSYMLRAPFYYDKNDSTIVTTVSSGLARMNKVQSITVTLDVPAVTADRTVPSAGRLGSTFRDNIKVRNTGRDDVYDVAVTQFGGQGIDVESAQKPRTIAELNPSEEIVLEYPARFTMFGKVVIPATFVSVKDKYGNIHYYNVSSKTITVGDLIITEPAVNLVKEVVNTTDTTVTLAIFLHNLGGTTASGTYTDGQTVLSTTVGPGERKRFEYTMQIVRIPELNLNPGTFTYSAENRVWEASSNHLTVLRTLEALVEEQQPAAIPQEPENATVSNNGTSPGAFIISQSPQQQGKPLISYAFTIIIVAGFSFIAAFVCFTFVKRKLLQKKRRGEFDDYFT